MRDGSSNIKNFITIIYVLFENLLREKWPGIYIWLVQVTENYHRQKLFSPLTRKNISRHNKNILRLRTLLVFITKTVEALDENRKSVEYQKSKGKNVNQLWQKLSNTSINTRLVWEKKQNITYFGAMFFEVWGRTF